VIAALQPGDPVADELEADHEDQHGHDLVDQLDWLTAPPGPAGAPLEYVPTPSR
jgi:hypothetical protein